MYTIFLQQIIRDKLLLVVTNLSVKFKFEQITTNHL